MKVSKEINFGFIYRVLVGKPEGKETCKTQA